MYSQNKQVPLKTYYCRTLMGGNMPKYDPRENLMDGNRSSRSRTETFFAEISSWKLSPPRALSASIVASFFPTLAKIEMLYIRLALLLITFKIHRTGKLTFLVAG